MSCSNSSENSTHNATEASSNNLLRFECPICLTLMKEPTLTSCGHHFCRSCIESWLQRDGACCPTDNIPLRVDSDLFPDNFTRREISQTKFPCAYSAAGCTEWLSSSEVEQHSLVCKFNADQYKCTFKKVGCGYVPGDGDELKKHLEFAMQHHLELLSNAYAKIMVDKKSLQTETKMWSPSSKQKNEAAALQSVPDLVKSMYERIIVLEQRSNEQEITIQNLNRTIVKLKSENAHTLNEVMLRYCNGVYIWTVTDFSNKLECMSNDSRKMFYSQNFYTSPNGYRFCARLNMSAKEPDHLGLLVHVMQTEHDSALEWPFHGRISLTIVHPTISSYNIGETMITSPHLEAFQRPTRNCNPLGYGWTEFVQLDELTSKGFVQNNSLVVRIRIQTL